MAIFAYQAYWLVSMYHTMKSDMEHSIIEAMRTSDYNEMMLRIERMRRDDQDHGEISVSAGYNDEGGTEKIFSNPSLKETEDYITGRFS